MISSLLKPRFYVPLAVGFIFAILPFLTIPYKPFVLHMLILTFFLAYLSTSWNIVAGYAGQLSLGHPAFIGIGAYTSTLLFNLWGISPWIGMFVSGFLASIFGAIIGYPCFKLKEVYYAIGTLAFAEVMRIIFTISDITGGPMGLMELPLTFHWQDFQFFDKPPYYFIIGVMLTIVIIFTYKLERSRLGLYFVAIREDEDAAAALGINVTKYKLIAGIISSFLMGIGGVFYSQFYLYIHPDHVMSLGLGLEFILMGQIGGMGTVFGPLLGAFCLSPIGEFFRSILGSTYAGLHLIFYGSSLILAVILLPKGITPIADKAYKRLLKILPGKPH